MLGVGTLVHGLAPGLAAPVADGLVAWSFLVEVLGASLGLGRWLLDTSLLHHLARPPAAQARWASAALVALGLAAAAVGAVAFARRDLRGLAKGSAGTAWSAATTSHAAAPAAPPDPRPSEPSGRKPSTRHSAP